MSADGYLRPFFDLARLDTNEWLGIFGLSLAPVSETPSLGLEQGAQEPILNAERRSAKSEVK